MSDFLVAFVSSQYNIPSVAAVIIVIVIATTLRRIIRNVKRIDTKWCSIKLRKNHPSAL